MRYKAGYRRVHFTHPTEYQLRYGGWKSSRTPLGESPLLTAQQQQQHTRGSSQQQQSQQQQQQQQQQQGQPQQWRKELQQRHPIVTRGSPSLKKDSAQHLLPRRRRGGGRGEGVGGGGSLHHDEDTSSAGHTRGGGSDVGSTAVQKMQQRFDLRIGLTDHTDHSGRGNQVVEQHQNDQRGLIYGERNGDHHSLHSRDCHPCNGGGEGGVAAHPTNKRMDRNRSPQKHHSSPAKDEGKEEEEEEEAGRAESGELFFKLCKVYYPAYQYSSMWDQLSI